MQNKFKILALLYQHLIQVSSAATYNLALGKPTSSDSVFSTSNNDLLLTTPSAAAVDGVVSYCEISSNTTPNSQCYHNYGQKLFVSDGILPPWLRIDFGSVQTINTIFLALREY